MLFIKLLEFRNNVCTHAWNWIIPSNEDFISMELLGWNVEYETIKCNDIKVEHETIKFNDIKIEYDIKFNDIR